MSEIESGLLMSEIRLALAYLDSAQASDNQEQIARYQQRAAGCYDKILLHIATLHLEELERERIGRAVEPLRLRIEREIRSDLKNSKSRWHHCAG
jgi:hypothetical protein